MVSLLHHLGAIDIEGHMVLPRLEPGERHPPAPPVLCQAGRHSGGRSRGAFAFSPHVRHMPEKMQPQDGDIVCQQYAAVRKSYVEEFAPSLSPSNL